MAAWKQIRDFYRTLLQCGVIHLGPVHVEKIHNARSQSCCHSRLNLGRTSHRPHPFLCSRFRAPDSEKHHYRSHTLAECLNSDALRPQHLWLDVACIDQEDENTKMSDIGRQARIFAKAETALIWLSHHDTRQLEQTLRQFVAAIAQLEKGETLPIGWARTAAEGLAIILQDP